MILHQIGHTIGFFHEHARPDRDKYIKILWHNLIRGREHIFRYHFFFMSYEATYSFHSNILGLKWGFHKESNIKAQVNDVVVADVSYCNLSFHTCDRICIKGPPVRDYHKISRPVR